MGSFEVASQARFERALQGVGGGAGAEGARTFEELVSRYAEPHRRYHTLEHIEQCLRGFDRFRGLAERPAEVELAIWFHDMVYDPRATDNEARSAELARARLLGHGASGPATDRVVAHILATEKHRGDDRDSALVIDLDLSILGAEWPAFVAFERAIRVEYKHVPTLLFEIGRKRVLRSFARRPTIYRFDEIRQELEASARENLRRRLEGEGKAEVEPRDL